MNLSREDIARINARIGTPAVRVGKPATLRRGRGVRRQPGTMNKTEAAYARHLEAMAARGDIAWWKFEGVTLKLAHDTRYTVDFLVMTKDGFIQCHEVKGRSGETYYAEDDAKVKIKIAAAMFPFDFFIIFPRGKGYDGWEIKEVKC